MKKMFFGGLLFLSGFIGVLALVCISVFKPWSYNEIRGFTGFLLGSNTMTFFIICCALSVIGITISSFEVYLNKKE